MHIPGTDYRHSWSTIGIPGTKYRHSWNGLSASPEQPIGIPGTLKKVQSMTIKGYRDFFCPVTYINYL